MDTIEPLQLSELRIGSKIPYNDPRWISVALLKEGWEVRECLQIDRNIWRVLIYYPKWNALKVYVLSPEDK